MPLDKSVAAGGVRSRILGRAVLSVVLGGSIVGVAGWAIAQDAFMQQGFRGRAAFVVQNGSGTVPGDSSVYVPDSGKALEQLRLAERLEGQREWKKSAEVYQEVIENLGERVLPVGDEKTTNAGNATRYVTVARRVEEKLAGWPADGLTAYRDLYESPARDLLNAADDLSGAAVEAKLSEVVGRYLLTEAGLEAALRLVDVRLEAGDFAGAGDLTGRLLERHPGLAGNGGGNERAKVSRSSVLFRAVLAARGAGVTSRYEAAMGELKQKWADAKGVVGGKEVVWAEAAAAIPEFSDRGVSANSTIGTGYPMPGGDASRSALTSCTARATAPVGRISLPSFQSTIARQTPQSVFLQNQRDGEEGSAATPGSGVVVMPAATAQGELFFQDGFRVWGVALESGAALQGWVETYPQSSGVYMAPRGLLSARDHQYSVTVTDQAVLAVMGYADIRQVQFVQAGSARSMTRVVRLDRMTGKMVWENSAAGFPESVSGLRDLTFSGSPLQIGDAVYIAARGSKGNQFDDAYVVCLDYTTGAFRKAIYVASAPAPTLFGIDAGGSTPTVTHLAYASGKIIAQTNLGAMACIDAISGRAEWISIYNRDLPDVPLRRRWRNGGAMNPDGAPRPWTYNPPIVSGGYVFALPPDAKDVLVYDLASGEEVKRIPRNAMGGVGGGLASVLLWADSKSMILAGDSRIQAIDWQGWGKTPAASGGDDDTSAILWRQTLASPLRGRPFVTRQSVYVPTEKAMLLMDLSRGAKIVASTPTGGRSWREGEGAVNVVAAGEHVVLAGTEKVEIWTDLESATKKFDEQLVADPTSAVLRVRYAEVLFGAGQEQRALGMLEKAGALVPDGTPGVARTRLYTASMTMAEQAVIRSKEVADASPEQGKILAGLGLKFYERAAAMAVTPTQQVEWRRRKAGLLVNPADVLALWQEVLLNPEWRQVSVMDEATPGEGGNGGERPASAIATEQIAQIIKTNPALYDPYERVADAQLTAAATDPTALRAIASNYPNSTAAPRGLLAAAKLLEDAGDRRASGRIYRETYFRYPNFERKAEIIEAMARTALAIPGQQQVALSRLALGSRLFNDRKLSKPLIMPDGAALQASTFGEAADKLRTQLSAQATSKLPDFNLPDRDTAEAYRITNKKIIAPLEDVPGITVRDVIGFIDPIEKAERPDRVAVRLASGAVSVVTAGKGVSFTVKSQGPQVVGCAFTAETFTMWDSRTLTSTDESGKVLWTVAVSSLPPLALMTEAETGGLPNQPPVQPINRRPPVIRFAGGGVVRQLAGGVMPNPLVVRGGLGVGGRVIGGDVEGVNGPGNGENIAQVALAGGGGERLMVLTDKGRLVCFSALTGKVIWQARPALVTGGGMGRMLTTDDFVVTRYMDGASVKIVAFDAESGDQLWKLATTDASRFPTNVALSPDGTVLMTLPDRIVAKDLFQPGSQVTFESASDTTNPFAGMDGPTQLLTWEGLLLAATDQGQYVRAFVIADQCKPVRFAGPKVGMAEINSLFATKARPGDATLKLQVVGKQLYISSSRSVVSYDLRKGVEHWSRSSEALPFSDVFLGRGFLLAAHIPHLEKGKWVMRLSAVSTASVAGANGGAGGGAAGGGGDDQVESGLLVHHPLLGDVLVSDAQSPNPVRPTEGGLFYLAPGAELRFMKGTAK